MSRKTSLTETFTLCPKFLSPYSSFFYNKGHEVYTAAPNNPTQKEISPLLLTENSIIRKRNTLIEIRPATPNASYSPRLERNKEIKRLNSRSNQGCR